MSKVALVTGSTSGIGQSIAQTLASRGVSVILTGFGEELEIARMVEEIKSTHGVEASYIFADLSQPDHIGELWTKIKISHPSGVDILINCGGLQKKSKVEDVSLDDWNRLLAVMVTAPFHLTKLALPDMKHKDWGRIVNISSVMGLVGAEYGAAYCTAKHGMIGLTKVVALETAKSGITCNVICPGYVETPLVGAVQQQIALATGVTKQQAKVAALAAFMCSDAASEMTGASVVMDGGYTAQ